MIEFLHFCLKINYKKNYLANYKTFFTLKHNNKTILSLLAVFQEVFILFQNQSHL